MNPLPLAFGLCFFLLPLGADEAAAPAPTPTPTPSPDPVEVRIFVQPLRGILTENSKIPRLPSTVHCVGALGNPAIQLYRGGYAKPVRLPAGAPLVLQLLEDGEPGREIVRETFPREWEKVMVVLDPSPGGDGLRLRAEIFPAGQSRISAGWHTFTNRLETGVELRIGDQTHTLPAGESISVKATERRERIFIRETGTQRGRLYNGAIRRREDRGMLHLLSPHPGSARRIRVLSLGGPLEED